MYYVYIYIYMYIHAIYIYNMCIYIGNIMNLLGICIYIIYMRSLLYIEKFISLELEKEYNI